MDDGGDKASIQSSACTNLSRCSSHSSQPHRSDQGQPNCHCHQPRQTKSYPGPSHIEFSIILVLHSLEGFVSLFGLDLLKEFLELLRQIISLLPQALGCDEDVLKSF